MRHFVTHYSGGLSYTSPVGQRVNYAAGWPACCHGLKARRIREEGAQSTDAAKVTCATCLKRIAASERAWERRDAEARA